MSDEPASTLGHRLFPRRIDNTFTGYRAALWLFGAFVMLRLIMSVNSVLFTRAVATGADGIPLDAFGAAGASRFLLLFSFLGLSQLLPALLGLIALIRYRAMIPLLYLLLLVELGGRRVLALAHGIERSGPTPVGFYINIALLAVLVVGLVLAVMAPPAARPQANGC